MPNVKHICNKITVYTVNVSCDKSLVLNQPIDLFTILSYSPKHLKKIILIYARPYPRCNQSRGVCKFVKTNTSYKPHSAIGIKLTLRRSEFLMDLECH